MSLLQLHDGIKTRDRFFQAHNKAAVEYAKAAEAKSHGVEKDELGAGAGENKSESESETGKRNKSHV